MILDLRIRAFLLCAVLVCLCYSSNTLAQERLAGLDVSASVTVRCKVESRGDIAFGALDPAQAINTFASTEARVSCTRCAVYRIAVDNGRNFNAVRGARQMVSERGEALAYTLTIENSGGLGNGWFKPSVTRLVANVRGNDYVDLPGGHYQDVVRISVEY